MITKNPYLNDLLDLDKLDEALVLASAVRMVVPLAGSERPEPDVTRLDPFGRWLVGRAIAEEVLIRFGDTAHRNQFVQILVMVYPIDHSEGAVSDTADPSREVWEAFIERHLLAASGG